MPNYELTLVIHPQGSVGKQKQATDKIKQLVTDLKGKVNQWDDWGKKPLAYSIKGQDIAYYHLVRLGLPPTAPAKINQVLRTEKNLLRYLLVKAEKGETAPVKKPTVSPKKTAPTKTKATTTKSKSKSKPKPKSKSKSKT